jgi:hypothetical protein
MKSSDKLLIFTGIVLLVNIFVYTTGIGGDRFLLYFSDGLPVICSVISAICLFITVKGFRHSDHTRTFWLLYFIGIAMYFVAETIYGVLEIIFLIDMNANYPSLADFFWCGAYIPLFAGLLMMILGYWRSGFPMGSSKVRVLLTAAILCVSFVVFYFILVPIIKDNETTFIAKFFYLFYPIADVLIVIPVILLAYITSLFGKGSVSKPWRYLAMGFISFSVADLLYSYLSWEDLYGNGNLIDLAWNFGYLAIGIAGIKQNELMKSLNESTK